MKATKVTRNWPRPIQGWFDFLARQTRPPEHSLAFRVAVASNVSVALASVGISLDWPWFVPTGIVGTWLAMAVSYRFRTRNNWDIKAALSIGMMLAMFRFFWTFLTGDISDPRIPLAELLVWLQTLHSFDLPGRRDLNYSLLVALILMSIAAVTSNSMAYGLCLLVYGLTYFVAAAVHVQRLKEESLAGGFVPESSSKALTRPNWRESFQFSWRWLGFWGQMLALSGLLFLAFPKFQSFKIRALPFSWQPRLNLPRFSRGRVQNPGFPQTSDPKEFRKQARLNRSQGYAGFNQIVDLQLRGALEAKVALRIRRSQSSYLRGLAFDHYDGQFWTCSNTTTRTLSCATPPVNLNTQFSPSLRGVKGKISGIDPGSLSQENVQIISIETELPNIVLASSEAQSLFFPGDEVYRDRNGNVLSPYALELGMLYSVISREPREIPELLDQLSPEDRLGEKQNSRCYQLPESYSKPGTPEYRLAELAHRLTDQQPNSYRKVLALVHYLSQNYQYDLQVDRYPDDSDIAAHFVLTQKRGYCEQFATSLAVMTRCIGLPSRYVTGYLPGSYNPFTGNFEILSSDAHAWTEIYLPNYGWLTFDATPPGQVQRDASLSGQTDSMWMLVWRYLKGSNAQWPIAGFIGFGLLLAGIRRFRTKPDSIMRQALVLCQLHGYPKPAGWTLLRFAQECKLDSLSELIELHQQAVYRSGDPTDSPQMFEAFAKLKLEVKLKGHRPRP